MKARMISLKKGVVKFDTGICVKDVPTLIYLNANRLFRAGNVDYILNVVLILNLFCVFFWVKKRNLFVTVS